jgi:hypothetical protein
MIALRLMCGLNSITTAIYVTKGGMRNICVCRAD